jgi:hypothetical protein
MLRPPRDLIGIFSALIIFCGKRIQRRTGRAICALSRQAATLARLRSHLVGIVGQGITNQTDKPPKHRFVPLFGRMPSMSEADGPARKVRFAEAMSRRWKVDIPNALAG